MKPIYLRLQTRLRQHLVVGVQCEISKPVSYILYLIKSLTLCEIVQVFQLLMVIVSQLQGSNQLLPEPNPQQAQLIPLLITYLRKLNDTHLENIYIELENKNVSSQM